MCFNNCFILADREHPGEMPISVSTLFLNVHSYGFPRPTWIVRFNTTDLKKNTWTNSVDGSHGPSLLNLHCLLTLLYFSISYFLHTVQSVPLMTDH